MTSSKSQGVVTTAAQAVDLVRIALREAGSPHAEKPFVADGQAEEFWLVIPAAGVGRDIDVSGMVDVKTGEVTLGRYQIATINERLDPS